MRSSASLLLLATALSSPASFAVGGGGGYYSGEQKQKQCFGYTPQPSVSTFLGASLDYSTAERICCNNHRYAEYSGYLAAPEVDLFGRLEGGGETVFYDSVCGLPLFVAPRGRSFGEFRDESLKHGWPSFRPEEIISENVIIHDDGRMESRCLTHLGHNLPSGGIDRYCIDLVCVAGAPLTIDDVEKDERAEILRMIDDGPAIMHGGEFNVTSYTSSAEDFSGKYNDLSMMMVVVGVVVVVLVVGAGTMVYFGAGHIMRKNKRRQASTLTTMTTDQSKGGVDRLGAGTSFDTDGGDGGVYNTVQLSEEQ